MSESPHFRGTSFRVGEPISGSGTNPGKNVGAFYDHARELARLDSLLAGFLAPEIATRFQVANLRQNQLILITPSASLATRIKLQASELLSFLHASGYRQVQQIDIRVAPLQKPQPEPKIRRQSSQAALEAAELIKQLVQTSKR